jgi:hypothetical protein
MSEAGVIDIARQRGYEAILILEDDVEFAPEFNNKFNEWIKNVPEDWDMLYLGGNHNWIEDIPQVAPHVIRITNTYATQAFALKDTIYDEIYNSIMSHTEECDILLANVQKKCSAYCFVPNLAYQKAGYSDVLDKYRDYDFLRKR